MKRTSLILMCFIMTITLFSSCSSKDEKQNSDDMAQQVSGDMDDQKITESSVTKVTISSAGDCTLGSDSSFSGGTFEDVVRTNNNDYSYFFKNVRSIFEQDDITIVNLEGTLSENGSRQDKLYAFRGDPGFVNILKEGSVEAVTLANNHSADYGKVSLDDTKEVLKDVGIEYAKNMEIAKLNVKGVNVAVVGLYQLDNSADEIVTAAMSKAADSDLIVVQIHWGEEKADTPSDSQVKLAHKVIDLGADLVIGHHPHVLQGIEKYKDKYICYSLGNFCFGGNTDPSDKDTMIFQQTFSFKEGMVAKNDDYVIIPCSISSSISTNNYQPTPLSGSEKERVEKKIVERSKKISDSNLDLKFR